MKIDKRIVKTKTNIKNSLLELAQSKKLEDISVTELTTKASVNRSTFYLHYDSVLNVLEDIENEIAENIVVSFDAIDLSDIYGSTYKVLINLTSALDKIPNLKKCIFFSDNSPNIIQKLKQIFMEKIRDATLLEFPEISESDLKYPLTYISSGIIDSYLKWLRTNDGMPIESLVSELGKITVKILKDVTKK